MNYELAKELKDAGFRQGYWEGWDDHGGGKWMQFDGKNSLYDHETGDSEELYVPTLSELIEACRMFTDRLCLEQHSNDWRAGIYVGPKQFASGSTPEEAVARLWLVLNKKGV